MTCDCDDWAGSPMPKPEDMEEFLKGFAEREYEFKEIEE